jgi:hypothetical protein
MSTITIKTDNQMLINILIGACSSVAGTQIKVKNGSKDSSEGTIDDDAQEDAAMRHFMAEADPSQKVPIDSVLAKLRAKSARK